MHKIFDLTTKIKKARMIWVCGNGGSAACAEHFATDLIKKGYPAVALSSNTSIITMIANDYGFEHIFSRQLIVYGKKEDLLITISCSGTSQNVVNAEKLAKLNLEMDVFQFEVFDETRDYGKLEDKHLAFAHEVAKAL